jgi:TATA element modulatory factor
LILAREAAAIAAKKESVPVQNKSLGSGGGAAGRMTLQERLVSIAKSRTGSPKIATGEDLGISTVRSSGDLTRMESNGLSKENGMTSPVRTTTPKLSSSLVRNESPAVEVTDVPSRPETPDIPVASIEPTEIPAEPLEESIKAEVPNISDTVIPDASSERTSSVRLSTTLPPDTDPATVDLISQLRSDLETCESRRIEESQEATSRITSLEQKLKILSGSLFESSKEVASNPSATPFDRKLAEREEKIALLLDEGLLQLFLV